jgi:hypothetical protein
MRARQMFRVTVRAHELERWSIESRCVEVPAASEAHARLHVVREAHRAAGVPPLRSLVRRSFTHATAEAARAER